MTYDPKFVAFVGRFRDNAEDELSPALINVLAEIFLLLHDTPERTQCSGNYSDTCKCDAVTFVFHGTPRATSPDR